ncbi:DnaD domain protein [Ligilactobacillus equi]|uniref:DnaB/C C-terminal domain-containing protein n=1 Tax=Ligilactobacillus equi DSM 15833 = JCM 10991 TaxID=1423740 RepID=A0A0R1TGU9_9LACO|nr:DnaD domain protein [Ligilactobacillus equi]KRL76635.1 hypothetical protein FC36_GL001877 [Ligilactobacillus equi DSM 15833 = JCM 10991]
MDEFQGSNLFLNIPTYVAYDEEVLKKPKAAYLYGEINSMLNVTGRFYMSNNTIARRLKVSRQTAISYVNLLKERGFIETENVVDEKTGVIKGRYITYGSLSKRYIPKDSQIDFTNGSQTDLTRVVKPTLPGWSNGFDGGSQMGLTQIEHINKTTNRSSSTPTPSENVFNKLAAIGIPANGMNTPVIIDYIDQLGDDLVAHAIDYMADQAQRPNMNYLKKILEGYLNKNIKTVAQAKQSEEAFKTQQTTYANKRKSNRRRIVQKETLPDWAQEGYQVPKLSDEDRAALEDKRKKLEAKMFGKKDK